jgi:hypothetical protein
MAGYSPVVTSKKRANAGCVYVMRYFKALCISLNKGERKQGVLRGWALITPRIKILLFVSNQVKFKILPY